MKDFTLFWRLASTETTRNSFDNKAVKTISLRFTVTTLFDSNRKKSISGLCWSRKIQMKEYPGKVFLTPFSFRQTNKLLIQTSDPKILGIKT